MLLAVEIRESPADMFKKNTNHIRINCLLYNNSLISKLLLENENLKIQIENLEIENDIINQFMIENK